MFEFETKLHYTRIFTALEARYVTKLRTIFLQDLTAAADVFKGDVKTEATDTLVQMQKCRKPIIGAINGHCITAGFEIALGCDILVASTAAKFIDTHAK